MSTKTRATIEDLYSVEGKAELINGEIVQMPPRGDDPGYASDEIFVSLREYAKRTKTGRAFADNKGFHSTSRTGSHSARMRPIIPDPGPACDFLKGLRYLL